MKNDILAGKLFILILAVIFLSSLASCGGGGGDGDFIGAAQVRMSASPQRIDTGDRTRVTVRVDSVIEDGIALKLKFPPGLLFVPESATLLVSGQQIAVDPDDYVTHGNFSYLVFFLSRSIFGKSNQGDLVFTLQGSARVIDGRIQVDADVDDPRLPNTGEFDVNNPEFTAEDEVRIEVAL